MLNKRGATTDTTAEQTETAQSSTVDLSDIPGQYWSNAKKLLKSRGADLSNAVILTDDGSTPIVDANWVVASAHYNGDGNLEVQLTHKGGSSRNASGDQGATDSSSSEIRPRIWAIPHRTWAIWQRTPGMPCKTAFRTRR